MTTAINTRSAIDSIDTIPDPETFYEKYIRRRQPVHLTFSGIGNSTSSPTDAVADAPVPIILENPTILQYDPFICTLQRIIDTYKQRCSNYNGDDDDDDDDDDFMEQYKNVEVNVRSSSTTRTLNNDHVVDDDNTLSSKFTTTNVVKMIPTKMAFHDIYQKIFVERNEQYYMTTPTIPLLNKELGQPDIMTFITRQILLHYEEDSDGTMKLPHQHRRPYIPLRPKLFGNLIPMNVGNIWIGCTSSNHDNATTDDNNINNKASNSLPSSSGLHHDYHDNLYCLIHGTKIVLLSPPESIYGMEMMGTLHTLHSNGRIVYHEQIESSSQSNGSSESNLSTCPIRPDGALLSVETILQLELRKEEIETELSKLSSNSKNQSKKAMDKIELLEEELNMIEEQILDIEMSGDSGNEKQNVNRLEDGDDDSDCEYNTKYDDEDDDDSEEEGIFFGNVGRINTDINKTNGIMGKNDDHDKEQEPMRKRMKYNHADMQNPIQSKNLKLHGSKTQTLPPNFVKRYDPTKVSSQTITMHAGDALYIPAGWFHEVTSIGADHSTTPHDKLATPGSSITNAHSAGPYGIHMAINYWYHPPDVVDSSKRSGSDAPNFHQPYISKFWQRDWDQRQLDK